VFGAITQIGGNRMMLDGAGERRVSIVFSEIKDGKAENTFVELGN